MSAGSTLAKVSKCDRPELICSLLRSLIAFLHFDTIATLMALAPRLDLRQSQSLVMTPQLQQAIKLLTMSSLEIEAFVAEEVERNPLLEIGDSEFGKDGDGASAIDLLAESAQLNQAEAGSDIVLTSNDMSAQEGLDSNFSADANEAELGSDGMLGLSGNGAAGNGASDNATSGEGPDFDSFAAADIGLRDHLLAQAGSTLSGRQLFLVGQLIEQIENTGYLGEDLMAMAHRLGVDMAEMEAALALLQGFDPTGVGARNLSECIALQAKEADRYDPCMARLIDNLDLVARGGFDQLKRLCRVDDEDLRDMLTELRGYDPKPGCRFEAELSIAISPDIFLTSRGDAWRIELNSANLPRLLVNRSYHAELSKGGVDKETKAWLNDNLAEAHWLIKAMDQRQRTIIKVTTEIVKQQDGFFRGGVAHLRSLTLREVAEAIDMHESTVSRVTSNKYLICDRGIFDLKYFFSSGVQSVDGDNMSAAAVKNQIKALIDAEAADKILSDDTLVDMLTAQGTEIARRTVAKYREAMGYGSSVQRRRDKKMGR
jgi:RNA polymerase sigma-54 factor